MIRSWGSALGFSLAGAVALGVLAPQARADDDTMGPCIAASDKGLDLRKQGKLMEARQALATCADATCGVEISGVCQKRLADINAALPSIVFLPKDGAGNDVTRVTMYVDGASTGDILDGRPVTLDPGTHTFKFEVAGLPPVERSFVLGEGAKDRQERIEMAPPAPPPPPPRTLAPLAATAQESSHEAHAGGSQRVAGFVVGGAGLAGVAVGSVFGLMASSNWSASKSDCGSSAPGDCLHHAQAVNEHDAAVSQGTLSTVAFVAGGAAIATGIILLLTAPRASHSSETTAAAVQLMPSVGPGGASLSVGGSF